MEQGLPTAFLQTIPAVVDAPALIAAASATLSHGGFAADRFTPSEVRVLATKDLIEPRISSRCVIGINNTDSRDASHNPLLGMHLIQSRAPVSSAGAEEAMDNTLLRQSSRSVSAQTVEPSPPLSADRRQPHGFDIAAEMTLNGNFAIAVFPPLPAHRRQQHGFETAAETTLNGNFTIAVLQIAGSGVLQVTSGSSSNPQVLSWILICALLVTFLLSFLHVWVAIMQRSTADDFGEDRAVGTAAARCRSAGMRFCCIALGSAVSIALILAIALRLTTAR